MEPGREKVKNFRGMIEHSDSRERRYTVVAMLVVIFLMIVAAIVVV